MSFHVLFETLQIRDANINDKCSGFGENLGKLVNFECHLKIIRDFFFFWEKRSHVSALFYALIEAAGIRPSLQYLVSIW